MWRATHRCVLLNHFGRHLDAVVEDGVEAVLLSGNSLFALLLAVDDVELRTARLVLRVDIVRLAGCCQSATLVVNTGQTYFGRDVIVERVFAKFLALLRVLAPRVARLNHEVGNDTVEQQRIVEVVLAYNLKEVVAMERSLVVQLYTYVAHRGLNQHLRTLARLHYGGLAVCRNHRSYHQIHY